MTLRNRLLLALLALALIPTAVFTWFTLDQLGRSIDRWYRPGVARALEAGLEIGKGSLARFESTLLAQSDLWASRWTGAMTPAMQESWGAQLAAAGVDFLQIYRHDPDGHWHRIAQVTPKGVIQATPLDLSDAIPPALESGSVLRSAAGAIAGVSEAQGGDVVVAGVRVQPEFFQKIESLGQGTAYYRQLDIYVDLQRRVYAILVAAIVLLLVGGAVFLSHAIARDTAQPIQTLSEALERVAAGDLGTRVEPKGALELRSLGSSFNEMATRLETAREAVQQAEREAAWRDVARKLAHEFRNILTPMQLSLQLVEAQIAAVPEAERESFRRSLGSVLREVDHLHRLAEQFSQYARLPEPRFETFDLDEVVRAVLQANAATLDPVTVRCEPATIRGDRLLLTRAIHNLALNAREASPMHAPIELALGAGPKQVTFEVLDRGSGLPQDVKHRLFEPYVSTKRRGSGLGLSLVRDIVHQHGGTITLEDRSGGGARAVVVLPCAAEHDAHRELPRKEAWQ